MRVQKKIYSVDIIHEICPIISTKHIWYNNKVFLHTPFTQGKLCNSRSNAVNKIYCSKRKYW